MRLPQGRPGAADEPDKGPGPLRVRDQKEFRDALKELRGTRSYQAVATASKGGLSTTTIHNVLTKDALPSRDFVAKYLPACGLGEADQAEWLRCWDALSSRPAPPAGPGRRWGALPGGARGRLRAGLAVGTVLVLTAALVAWQAHESHQDRLREQHCGTSSPHLVTGPGGECTGVTDGHDGAAVFGDDLKPVMKAIAAENTTVTDGGDYVTFAFLTPLSSTDANSLTVGQYVAELEGAYTAVEEENKKDSRPRIRLLVASMGSSERAWRTAVDQLTSVKDGEHLVAVAGLGLSQQETVDATRELAKADLPMIGDLITADGFDATGAVDGKGPINGLARVALSNTDQLTAISKELGSGRRTAALVSTQVTPNGTRDLYTESLRKGFRSIAGLKKHLDPNSDFSFDPRGGPGAILPTISQNFCNTGKTIDTVYYAARVKYLPGFLDALAQRSCHAQPLTVITGSDAASLDPTVDALHTADAPVTVLYASFPGPAQLSGPANPDRGLYEAFVKDFTAPTTTSSSPPGTSPAATGPSSPTTPS
ncbi:helix-turn-helix domain-containing protein [Streptomyces longwoodensis]|uniref:helix-turn-helix domain-containing protein n=1 Tax=Streptomyces longwoodensis TaxID=68231 RepID=UPI0030E2BE6B